MDITTLNKANELNERIIELSKMLEHIQWAVDKNETTPMKITIAIRIDIGVYREKTIELQPKDKLIPTLIKEITQARNQVVNEFNAL
ncbi:MAG: hypothetical protein H6553_06730 [Chitinophagales bacterium]|nr:hypothetical protein [Chitinophagales bacterium]